MKVREVINLIDWDMCDLQVRNKSFRLLWMKYGRADKDIPEDLMEATVMRIGCNHFNYTNTIELLVDL